MSRNRLYLTIRCLFFVYFILNDNLFYFKRVETILVAENKYYFGLTLLFCLQCFFCMLLHMAFIHTILF